MVLHKGRELKAEHWRQSSTGGYAYSLTDHKKPAALPSYLPLHWQFLHRVLHVSTQLPENGGAGSKSSLHKWAPRGSLRLPAVAFWFSKLERELHPHESTPLAGYNNSHSGYELEPVSLEQDSRYYSSQASAWRCWGEARRLYWEP